MLSFSLIKKILTSHFSISTTDIKNHFELVQLVLTLYPTWKNGAAKEVKLVDPSKTNIKMDIKTLSCHFLNKTIDKSVESKFMDIPTSRLL